MSRITQWGVAVGAVSLIAAATAAYLHEHEGRERVASSASAVAAIDAGTPSRSFLHPDATRPPSKTTTAVGGPGSTRRYIVVFKDPALASYQGEVAGIGAPERHRDRDGTLRLDSRGYNARRYVGYLKTRQQQAETRMATIAGRSIRPRHTMQHALNGIIVDLTEREARDVRSMSDVRLVEAYREYRQDTDVGPRLIGAEPVWLGTNPGAPSPYKGEGIVVGILDSGINFGSPSFAAVGPVDGYTYTNPLGAGHYLGTCAPGGVDEGRCNSKLIGGYDFVCNYTNGAGDNVQYCNNTAYREEPGFADTNSHGSHVASTVAGNVRDVVYKGANLRISGVAPHANIIAYDVCYTDLGDGGGWCPNVSTAAAVDQAVADGIVKAINFSIGGGNNPWNDATSLAFLGATDAGIFVAAAAGNSGPGAGTTNHLEPWVSTTAATQHGRGDFASVINVTGPSPVPATVTQIFMNAGTGGVSQTATIPATTPLRISAGIGTTSDGCAAFPANAFAGAIAVIRRGGCTFSVKVNNATAAGAAAVVIANNQAGVLTPVVTGTTIPAFMVTQADGNALRDFGLANPATATAQIPLATVGLPNTPDALAGFSGRGPSGNYDVLKPDVAAPGVRILAVVAGDTISGHEQDIGMMDGTSMASPHQAGAAALMRQARPTWTVPEVKSALAMTATPTVYLEDQVSLAGPLARGSGRIRVDQAINAGLVLNETTAHYIAANPAIGGDPKTLNQPNLYNRSCYPTCTFYRTFRNTKTSASSFTVQLQGVTGTVSPLITVPGNGSLTVKFTIYAYSLPPTGAFSTGTVVLTPVSGGPVLRLPVAVAVQPPVATLPASRSLSIARNAVGSASFPLSNTGGSNLNYTFVNNGTGYQRLSDTVNGGLNWVYFSSIYTDPVTAGVQAHFAGDDFVVAQPTTLTTLYTEQYVWGGAALSASTNAITWSIYPDAGGVPAGNPLTNAGAAVWSYTAAPASAGLNVVGSDGNALMTLDLAAAGQTVNLPPGRYWLVVSDRATTTNRLTHYASSMSSGAPGFAGITIDSAGHGDWSATDDYPGLTLRIAGQVACGAPWISNTYPGSGVLARGASVQVATVVYGTGLASGSYSANVCVQSNDPVYPRIAMPLNLTVTP